MTIRKSLAAIAALASAIPGMAFASDSKNAYAAAPAAIYMYSTHKTADLVRFGLNIPINIPLLGGGYGGSSY